MDIAKYNCPGCEKELEYCSQFLGYRCLECNIFYLLAINIAQYPDNQNRFYVDSTVNNEPLCYGDFEYCCRIYKLKVFA